jgi:hypothetical protein
MPTLIWVLYSGSSLIFGFAALIVHTTASLQSWADKLFVVIYTNEI